MFKKIFILCLLIFTIYIMYPHNIKTPNYLETNNFIQENKETNNLKKISLEEINKKLKSTNTIYDKNIPIRINQNGINFRASAELAFKKNRNFRLTVSAITGRELDLGSNNELFWFWSKRMRPSYLYFCDYKNIENSRLKTVFNPLWIMECLNTQELNSDYIDIQEKDNLIKLSYNRTSILNEDTTIKILIDKNKNQILGRYLYKDNVLIAICEYNYYNSKLNKLYFDWKEENIIMEWNLKNIQYNTSLSDSHWVMPKIGPMIDIGN